MMKISLCLSALCLLFFLAGESFACSCDVLSELGKSARQLVQKERADSKAVFSGEVTKIILNGLEGEPPAWAEVHFKTIKAWKGEISETAVVFTARICCICGYPFAVGERYLVYAYGDERLATNICTRTTPLRFAGEDVKFLGKAKKTFIDEEKHKSAENNAKPAN